VAQAFRGLLVFYAQLANIARSFRGPSSFSISLSSTKRTKQERSTYVHPQFARLPPFPPQVLIPSPFSLGLGVMICQPVLI
jgi:hypothetical protein